ncbi:MAG: hypothetical protein ACLS5Z_01125 [Clostridium fessum]
MKEIVRASIEIVPRSALPFGDSSGNAILSNGGRYSGRSRR